MQMYLIESRLYEEATYVNGPPKKLLKREFLKGVCEGKSGVKEFFRFYNLQDELVTPLMAITKKVDVDLWRRQWVEYEAIPVKSYKKKTTKTGK